MFKSLFATTVLYVLFSTGTAFAYSGEEDYSLKSRFIYSSSHNYVANIGLKGEEGREFRLLELLKGQFKGHYILLNIWATWCVPCVKEMKYLDQAQKKLEKEKIKVIALSEDHEPTVVSSFFRRHSISNLGVFLDLDKQAPNKLKLKGIPTSLLIAPEGREIGRVSGDLDWSSDENIKFLTEITNNPVIFDNITRP